jgi:hypothetical protein
MKKDDACKRTPTGFLPFFYAGSPLLDAPLIERLPANRHFTHRSESTAMSIVGLVLIAALTLVYVLNISLLWRSTRKPESEAEKTRKATAPHTIRGITR